jgi:tRNA nucleotidyltransferase (CCA-adding enzyme)
VADLAIDGDDLRQAGVSAGPALGRLLQRLLDLVLADPTSNHRDVLLARVRSMLHEDGAPA